MQGKKIGKKHYGSSNDGAPILPPRQQQSAGAGPSPATQAQGTAAAAAARIRPQVAPGDDEAGAPDVEMEDASEAAPLWARRKGKEMEAWGEQTSSLQQQYLSSLPASLERSGQQRASFLKSMGESIAATGWQGHQCSAMQGPCTAENFQPQASSSQVTYYGLTCCGPINLTLWQCKCCSQLVSPHAVVFD